MCIFGLKPGSTSRLGSMIFLEAPTEAILFSDLLQS